MKGDFSRFTFHPEKHYIGTLMQQGRVQLDADWNEQQAIHRHQRETAHTDVIGLQGVPKVGGGFAVGLAAGHTDLTISPGRIYLDGMPSVNDAPGPVLLSDQPHLKLAAGNVAGFTPPTQSGRYMVYLDVWERHVTALEDPQILEKALGGVDTATRAQMVWQVRLTSQPLAADAACGQFGPAWIPPGGAVTGQMTAQTETPQPGDPPCILPPVAGYRGLENQLYRVEIHRGGTRDDPAAPATIKWSRDNGTVATAVSVSGQVLTADDLGRDEARSFAPGQWVEIIDQHMALADQRGHLLQIASIDHGKREITISAATPVPAVDTNTLVLLRRWDNHGNAAGPDGIPMSAQAVVLEDSEVRSGIQVSFSAGTYRSGDYWMIPARTAVSSETGTIEWPRDSLDQPQAQSPHGIRHHYCPLALVDFNQVNGQYALVADGDCRRSFPALTQIAAQDVSFDGTSCNAHNLITDADTVQEAIDDLCAQLRNGCTFVITPETDLAQVIERINTPAVTHAKICFSNGEYHVSRKLVIGSAANAKGHLIVTGFGAGTRLIADNAETFLQFENCDSVTVRDCYVEARRTGSSAQEQHLQGALNFVDCGAVSVESSHIKCGAGPVRAAACLSAAFRNAKSTWTKTLRVHGCRLEVGHEQVGILSFNATRTWIEDNQIDAAALPAGITLDRLLEDKDYRAMARRPLYNHLRYNQPPADMTRVETISVGNRLAFFSTASGLVGQWQALLDSLGPRPSTFQMLRDRLKKAADRVLLGKVNTAGFPAFADWRSRLSSWFRCVGSQAIVVTGSVNGGETWILNNSIRGVLQGIRVAYSKKESTAGAAVRALGVQIRGNRIQLTVTPIMTCHPEGLFVGSYSDELLIEDNKVTGAFTFNRSQLDSHAAGLKVHGLLGLMLAIRHNTVASVHTAIQVVPLNSANTGVHRWLVADNLTAGFDTNLDISDRIDEIGNPPHATSYRYKDIIALLNGLLAARR
jgi:hypothetical protein